MVVSTVSKCDRCALCGRRRRIVNGEGPSNATIAFIGEAPGALEDESGRPFVGRSGKFLDSVLERKGIRRAEVFVTNVVRCRPPLNRKPRDDEIRSCLPNLASELKKIRPKVVVALGAVAVAALTGSKGKLKEIIGKATRVDFEGADLLIIPCYHPSAAMRNRKMRVGFEKAVAKAISISRAR